MNTNAHHQGSCDDIFEGETMIRAFLLMQSTEFLTELMMEAARLDTSLRRVIHLKASMANSDSIEKTMRASIDAAIDYRGRGFMSHKEESSMATELHAWTESLETLCIPGSKLKLLDLIEYGIVQIDRAQENSDTGFLLGMELDAIADLHLRYCRMIAPDPLELAERLARCENTCEIGFRFDINGYTDLLGASGMSH